MEERIYKGLVPQQKIVRIFKVNLHIKVFKKRMAGCLRAHIILFISIAE